MSLINVSNLTFSYPGSFDNVFENVSFQIDTDWKLGFVGRNGRGKTTFLNLLMGRYEYSGKILSCVPFDYFPYPVSDPSKMTVELLAEICNSTDKALELAQQSWFNEGLQRLQQFVKFLKTSADEAFLYLKELVEIFDDKEKQNQAFELLLQLFNQERMSQELLKTFQAIKMWKSNVRFESSLTFIVL